MAQVYPKEKNHAQMSDKGQESGVKKRILPARLPRYLFSAMHEAAQRKDLKNPPGLEQFQLIMNRTQGVQ